MLVLLGIKSSDLHAQTSTNQEIKAVYDFVFGSGSGDKLGTIVTEDKEKANLFVQELTAKSCAMASVESVFRSTITPNRTVQEIIQSLVKQASNECPSEIKEGKIYESVKATLANNWKSAFEVRIQTGSW